MKKLVIVSALLVCGHFSGNAQQSVGMPSVATDIKVSDDDQKSMDNSRPEAQAAQYNMVMLNALIERIRQMTTEYVRLTTCYKAGVKYESCGQISKDGKTVSRKGE